MAESRQVDSKLISQVTRRLFNLPRPEPAEVARTREFELPPTYRRLRLLEVIRTHDALTAAYREFTPRSRELRDNGAIRFPEEGEVRILPTDREPKDMLLFARGIPEGIKPGRVQVNHWTIILNEAIARTRSKRK